MCMSLDRETRSEEWIKRGSKATLLNFPACDPPRGTSSVAFDPCWVYDVPSESEDNVEKG